jgi:hypothetical protein
MAVCKWGGLSLKEMTAYQFGEALEVLCNFCKGLIFDKAVFMHVQSTIELNLQAVTSNGWIGIFANQFGTFVGVVDADLVTH